MAQRSFTVGIPEELEQRVVDAARGLDITRNAFVRRALEAALGQTGGFDLGPLAARTNPSEPTPPRAPDPPAPPRAPVVPNEFGEPAVQGAAYRSSANYGSHERYGPRVPRGKPFQKS